ncbi:HI1506-related protein [Xenorhabdus thailandensis]|uniref:HI1506-related protein n=1 Tax=Xenorhabdus thailandensis TaxID=3136255 RepID=UPI0030F41D2D
MSDETNIAPLDTLSPLERVGIKVVNTAHDGYRRAGLVLQPGENSLPFVTRETLQALEADPRLSVTVITADPDDDPKGGLDNQDIEDAVKDSSSPEQQSPTQDKRGNK